MGMRPPSRPMSATAIASNVCGMSEVYNSLGFLYTAVTAYLGFKPFAEGTVMALAGTGGPTYANKFSELVRLEPEGRFSINRRPHQLRHARHQEAVQGLVHGGIRSAAPA